MRYRVQIETYFGYIEGTFDADNQNKAKYIMFKYLKPMLSFKEYLEIFRPTAKRVEDDALKTWCEYGNRYGYSDRLVYIGMMKEAKENG